jgi:hypothetical protein
MYQQIQALNTEKVVLEIRQSVQCHVELSKTQL